MSENPFETERELIQQQGGIIRTGQASELGIPPRTLYRMHSDGLLVKESRGVFRLANFTLDSSADLVHVALRVPKGVICLISALAFHHLTTQVPHQVWLALPNQAEKPRLEYPPLRLVWLSPQPFRAGIEEHEMEGGIIRVYSPGKTVADLFKFRNKIGLDIALEALKEGLRQKRFLVDELLSYAKIDRVEAVMRPYIEALL